MREYGKVYTSFWTSNDIQALTDDGKMLAIYLLTSPHGNMIGCFRLPMAYAAEDMQWSVERVSKGYSELSENSFIYHCERSSYVLIKHYLDWNQFENPNVGKAAGKLFQSLTMPEPVKTALARALRQFCPYFPKRILDDYERNLEPFENPFELSAKTGTGTGAVTGTEAEHAEACASDADASKRTAPELPESCHPENQQPVCNALVLVDAVDAGQGTALDRRADGRHPDDIKAQTWRRAKALCDAASVTEPSARTAIGRMVADYTVEVVFEAVRVAEHHKPVQPIAFLKATCQRLAGEKRPLNKSEQLYADNDAAVDRMIAARAANGGMQ